MSLRSIWILSAVVACHASTSTPTADAGAVAAPTNAPAVFAKLATAVLVDVRQTSDAPGKRGDVVVELARSGEQFDWDGKAVRFPATLGERAPDPSAHRLTCSCPVTSTCPTCDSYRADDLARQHGSLSAAAVDAFLREVAKQTWAEDEDAGARWYDGKVDLVHVAITLPGQDEPVHVSYFDSRHRWVIDGRPIAGDGAALGAAYAKLSAAVGIETWLGALGPPVPTALPADFADLPKAAVIEVHDSWNGLGKTHDLVVRFERSGARLAYRAKVAGWARALGESTPDPYDPPDRDSKPCVCAVDAKCPCEHARDVVEKTGTLEPSKVEAFLRVVAAHGIDPSPPTARAAWTDDYPRGHVVVWVTPASTPIHLSFLNQQRQWRANGSVLSPDPATSTEPTRGQHEAINAAYRAMLTALGEPKWVDEVSVVRPQPRFHGQRPVR